MILVNDARPCRLPAGEPLIGSIVRLDPYRDEDLGALAVLLRDPLGFDGAYPFERPHESVSETEAFLRRRIDGGALPYVIRLLKPGADPAVVGTTSFSEIDVTNEKLQVGTTFISPDHWATGVNPEAKRLMLGHAFDECGFGRVKLQADARNTRSCDAIARLGAKLEGVLRRDIRRLDGSWRDTVVYSILADEWPDVRDGLDARVRDALGNG